VCVCAYVCVGKRRGEVNREGDDDTSYDCVLGVRVCVCVCMCVCVCVCVCMRVCE